MKKLFTFFTLLTMAVSTSWATDYNTDNVVFKSGEKIFYDLRTYGKNANIYNAAGQEYGTWTGDIGGVSNIIEITLTNDLTISASSKLFKSEASSWGDVKCSTLPTSGQNMIVSTDGKSASWGTYNPTFVAGETITYDFTAVSSGGCNYIDADGSLAYAESGKTGTTFDVTFTKNVFLSSNSTFLKFASASWHDIKYIDRSDNTYNIVKAASDGKSFTWTKTAPPAETKYTVTLTNATVASVEAGATGVAISASSISGKKFKEWVGSDGISFGNSKSASTTVHATKAGTAEATYDDLVTINLYFWNKDSWAEVAAHKWDGTAPSTSWPGDKLSTGVYKSDNHSIYKVTFTEGDYGKIIFNDNKQNNAQQTSDLDNLLSHNGQCYYGKDGGWNALPEENWAVTISAENGSVESSKYVGATEKQVAATPDDGYVFDRWEATGGVTIVDGSSATATITATDEGTLKAYFKKDATKFSVNFTALNGSVTATVGGNAISSGQQYTVGEPVNVEFTATPNDANYTFYGWYDLSNNKVSTENPFTATGINANYSIKAVYAGKYYLRHDWNQAGWDTKELTYDPTTALYYIYEYYGDNGFNYGSTDNPSSWNGGAGSNILVGSPAAKDWCYITTPGNGSITVTKVTESHNLAVVGANVTYTIQVNGQNATSALHMQSAVFAATAYDGFGFDGWYADALYENLLSSETSYEVTNIASDVTLYAKASAETQYTVTIANDVNSSTSSIQVGSAAKALAAPSINLYAFTNWTVEGDAVIADLNAANTTVTATGEATVTAHYALKHYYIKHTWGGSNWEWKEATQYEDGKFTLVAKYSEGCGCNWNDKADDEGKQWIENPTKVDNPQTGDVCEFTLDPVANTITITKMAGVEISINTTFEWATYFGNIALTVPDGAEAYYVQGINGDALDMVKISTIPANTGVLLYAEGGGDFTFNLTSTSDDYSDVNWLKGSVGDAVISNALTHYILSATSADNVGLYYPKGTGNNSGVGSFTNGAGKAYLEIPSSNPSVAARYLLRRPTMPTALDQVKEYAQDGKFIRNAQLIIVRDGHEYNAQGQLIK